jgi:hypothetical protein
MVQNRHVLLKQNQSGAKSKAIICPFAVKLTYVAAGFGWIIRNKSICCLCHCFIITRIIINTHFNTQASIKSVTRSYSSSKPSQTNQLHLSRSFYYSIKSPHIHLCLAIDLLQLEIGCSLCEIRSTRLKIPTSLLFSFFFQFALSLSSSKPLVLLKIGCFFIITFSNQNYKVFISLIQYF